MPFCPRIAPWSEEGGDGLLEKYLIAHCAPTLASLKTASLFCLPYASEEALESQLAEWNRRLEGKGIRLLTLRRQEQRQPAQDPGGCPRRSALVYVCRETSLRRDLGRPEVARFLGRYGYESVEPASALATLRQRLEAGGGFPHEIGLFLGYPQGAAEGFIQSGGRNSAVSGCWKVYGEPGEAVKLFAKFKKCRDVYTRLWQEGRSVWQLTVAA